MRFLHDKCKPHNGDKSSMNSYSYFYMIQEISGIYAIKQKLRLTNTFLHFVASFHVASLFSTGVDNKKMGVDNEKALELTNSSVFHRGRQ